MFSFAELVSQGILWFLRAPKAFSEVNGISVPRVLIIIRDHGLREL
jgi:hypothetical protein